LKLIGYENFGPRVPRFFVMPTSKGGLDENSRGLNNCALLVPRRTKILSKSFSLLVIHWIETFRCEMTFFDLLDLQASNWLKICSSRPLTCSVKRAWEHGFYANGPQLYSLDKACGWYWIGLLACIPGYSDSFLFKILNNLRHIRGILGSYVWDQQLSFTEKINMDMSTHLLTDEWIAN
jgi:hypothetical protein